MLLQLAVSLTILRLLNPAILGCHRDPDGRALAVAIVLADSGFSQALIRKGTPTADDYKSVFAFNVGVCARALRGAGSAGGEHRRGSTTCRKSRG